MHKSPKKPDSPIADFLEFKNIDIYSYEKSANVKKLCALISEFSSNITCVDRILGLVKKSQQARKKNGSQLVYGGRFANRCLELLLSTSYILLDEDLLVIANSIEDQVENLNSGLELWKEPGFARDVEKKFVKELPSFRKTLTSALEAFAKLENEY